MVCRQVERLLVKFLAGELSGKLKENVSAHLEGCSGCRKERDYIFESWQMLDNLPAPKLKEDFTPSLMCRIHSEQAEFIKVGYKLPRFIFRPLVPVLASAFVIVLLCLLFWKKPEDTRIATVQPPETSKYVAQLADNRMIQAPQKEMEVVVMPLPEPAKETTQLADNVIIQEAPQKTEVIVVRPPEPIKFVTLTNDKEIIQNLDILQNLELLQNMDVANELDVVEKFDSGIS